MFSPVVRDAKRPEGTPTRDMGTICYKYAALTGLGRPFPNSVTIRKIL
ncbi:Uncharacterized protein dnm_094300 [Desulfonema magnum]|uniref:Uncharacterized protein n=1 Tax=Desulfonema magnum TaxID=45655 RepID=A0A975GV37_9BACT|nr:Uncharacterized protein dnm_094300 [Desulfonema magnum]